MMTMKPIAVAAPLLLAALLLGSAHAQVYQWKDASGKTVFSDKPPPGKVELPRQKPIVDPAGEDAIEDVKPKESKAPKTLADRDLEFRKRQKESQAANEKRQAEQKQEAERQESCDNARRYLHSLESGDRIANRDDKGELVVLDDNQRAQEIAKARQNAQSNCK